MTRRLRGTCLGPECTVDRRAIDDIVLVVRAVTEKQLVSLVAKCSRKVTHGKRLLTVVLTAPPERPQHSRVVRLVCGPSPGIQTYPWIQGGAGIWLVTFQWQPVTFSADIANHWDRLRGVCPSQCMMCAMCLAAAVEPPALEEDD